MVSVCRGRPNTSAEPKVFVGGFCPLTAGSLSPPHLQTNVGWACQSNLSYSIPSPIFHQPLFCLLSAPPRSRALREKYLIPSADSDVWFIWWEVLSPLVIRLLVSLLQKQAHNGLVCEIRNYGPLFQKGEIPPAGKGGSEWLIFSKHAIQSLSRSVQLPSPARSGQIAPCTDWYSFVGFTFICVHVVRQRQSKWLFMTL